MRDQEIRSTVPADLRRFSRRTMLHAAMVAIPVGVSFALPRAGSASAAVPPVINIIDAVSASTSNFFGARPNGSQYVRYEDLDSVSLQQAFNRVPAGKQLTLPPATFECLDFAEGADHYGFFAPENVLGVAGSGIDKTVLKMVPGSSTKAPKIPIQATGATNNYSLLRVGSSTAGAIRGPIVRGFTLEATDQPIDGHTGLPHCYNGLQLYFATNSVVNDVRITGIPGNNSANPGETFSINDYRGTRNSLTRVELDGRNPAGTRVAASLVGLNYVNSFSATDCHWHDAQFGAGFTSYKSTGTINLTQIRSIDNFFSFNFEQNVCTVNMRDCVSQGSRSRTTSGKISPIWCVLDGNLGSSVFNIYDPIIDGGTPTPESPLIVVCHSTYGGMTSTQRYSDIHLYLNGVERRDCLRIATNETLT